MFALIETETLPKTTLWKRSGLKRTRAHSITEDTSLGVKIARAKLSYTDGARRDKAVKALFSELRANNIRGVVLPKDFEYSSLLPEYGLVSSSAIPLFRRLTPRLALYAFERSGNKPRVTILARKVTEALHQTVLELSLRSRDIALNVGEDSAAYALKLRKDHGISASTGQYGTNLWLLFDPVGIPDDAAGTILSFCGGIPGRLKYYDSAVLSHPKRLECVWPGFCDETELLCALLAAGAVSIHEIVIKKLVRNAAVQP